MEYRKAVESTVSLYKICKDLMPNSSYPKLVANVRRLTILVETWGALTQKLDPSHLDVLEEWREGR